MKFPLGSVATLCCQVCGHSEGQVIVDQTSKREGVVSFTCTQCKKEFVIQRAMRSYLACPYCGCRTIHSLKEILFSKITKTQDPKIQATLEDFKKEALIGVFSNKSKVKVVIPYYSGNSLIERAIKTWITPEVVFAITDKGTIPPGHGVCHQFFTDKNAKTENLSNKTKPFLIDLLKNLIEMFPDEKYYGFFNSDIVLPPGASIKFLIPAKGMKAVFHHRLDLIGNGEEKTHVTRLTKGNQVCVGKDGFVATKEVIEAIIQEVPDLVIGAPTWDDGLLLWAWKKFGIENIELRYGDIWHVSHPINWKFEERDAIFNQKQLHSIGVGNNLRFSINWNDISKRSPKIKIDRKVLGIIQPGRIGDIIVVLPIAKWYYDLGFKILWPVCFEFFPLFDYVNYVKPIEIVGSISKSYRSSIEILKGKRVDSIIDLGIGFGRKEKDWIDSGLHFNEWKYKEANVPMKERFNLQITRDFKKEVALLEYNKELYKLNGSSFSVIHDSGTKGPFKFGGNGVRIKPIGNFTVFDWIGIIEKAHHLYCVDSCIANLADQMGLCVDRRSVWFWQDIPDPDPVRRALGFPKLSKDWVVL